MLLVEIRHTAVISHLGWIEQDDLGDTILDLLIHLAIDDYPGILRKVMLSHLLQSDVFSLFSRCRRSRRRLASESFRCLHRSWSLFFQS